MKLFVAVSILLFATVVTSAQPSDDHELIQQLLRRVNELETELKQLQAGSSAAQPAVATTPPSATGSTAPPVPAVAAASTSMPQDMMMHDASGLPGMQFRGFSDVRYHASDQKGETNGFALGQFNLFVNQKISDRLSVLAEIVVEADQNNAFGIELERLLLQYSANDYLNLSFGRFHSAIGFYNTAYHHSTWMQTAIDRPFLFNFEDEGGILPIHNVGVSATGRIPSGPLGLHYVAEMGNGRTSRSPLDEPVQNVRDENNRKSYNLALYARPESLRGFQTGFSFYRDRLTPAGALAIQQSIFAAHAVYQSSGLEFLNEAVLVRNAVQGTRRVLNTPAFYSQISKPFHKWRPYFRYEYLNAPASDPVIGDVGLRYGPSAGIRYDFAEYAAFKLEYNRNMARSIGAVNGLTSQISFTF